MKALFAAAVAAVAMISPARAQTLDDGGTVAGAERAVQAYLAMWSRDEDINAASVARFYAPRVVYYGKAFSRAQVLADKRAYIRQWPRRDYREVPGSFAARCNADRSFCRINVVMSWRRTNLRGSTATGRARMSFDFVPAEGGHKIARESARFL